MALGLALFILELDLISRGVIMKRYLKVICWSYYYVLIDNNIRVEQGTLELVRTDNITSQQGIRMAWILDAFPSTLKIDPL